MNNLCSSFAIIQGMETASRHDSGPTAFQPAPDLQPGESYGLQHSAVLSLRNSALANPMPFLLPGSRRPSTKQIGLVFRQFSGFAVDGNQNKELVQRQYFGNDYFTRINSTPTGSHGGTTRPDNVGPMHAIQSDLRTKAVQEKRCYSIYRTIMEWAFWQYRAPLEDSLRGWAITSSVKFVDILDKGGEGEVEVVIYYNVYGLEKERVREDYQGIFKSESNTIEYLVLALFIKISTKVTLKLIIYIRLLIVLQI